AARAAPGPRDGRRVLRALRVRAEHAVDLRRDRDRRLLVGVGRGGAVADDAAGRRHGAGAAPGRARGAARGLPGADARDHERRLRARGEPSRVADPRGALLALGAARRALAPARRAGGARTGTAHEARALKSGRSRTETTPGAASQTAGIAFTTRIAVPRIPAVLWSPSSPTGSISQVNDGEPLTSIL